VRSCPLAPFVASTFCVKSGAHDAAFEFCTKVGAFALELLPGFSVLHLELRNLVLVLDQAKSFLFATIFFHAFITSFVLSFAARVLFVVMF
jgi:hypothetical protein